MPSLVANGVRLHYRDSGSGPETVVFSHSYLVSSEHFAPQIERLSARYRCIAFDHRGHGGSAVAAGGYDMENLYADAVGVIETLGCHPCHFVGLSTGGFIGLRLAIRRPELLRSLVLMDTSADEEPADARPRYRAMLAALRWLGYWPVAGRVFRMFFSPATRRDPARREELKVWRRRMVANDRLAMYRFGHGIFARAAVADQLGTVATPTLVVVGEDDELTPPSRAQRIAERIRGAQLSVIPRAGHLTTVERPRLVTQVLEGFLADRQAEGAAGA
jgi:pimeloyl-ACP methyl ester carboxylesterase